jgi:DNA-cytosine methyltransferase
MNVLSLFDGMSCGQIALDQLGIPVNKYYAAEIDKYAIQIARKNYPDMIHLGDVCNVRTKHNALHAINEDGVGELHEIDLLIGGSPCQGFSFAGKQLNFDDPRSQLFFEYVRLLEALKPKYFLLENVKMKKESEQVITEILGVEPIEINSSLVSAQNRKRLYWTNIPVDGLPDDKGTVLSDVLEEGATDREKSYCIDANYWKGGNLKSYFEKHRRQLVFHTEPKGARIVNRRLDERGKRQDYNTNIKPKPRLELRYDDKAGCITTVQKDSVVAFDEGVHWRKLTVTECERLQTVPDGYTCGVSNTQRYKMLGNGWTVDVIKHIFEGLKEEA